MDQKKKNPIAIISIIVLVLVVAYFGYSQYAKSSTGPADNIPAVTTGTSSSSSNTYKDGSYTALGDYYSPEGSEQIQVTLVLKDNVITDATVVSLAERPESKVYQGRFISGFKSYVVGKKLNDVSVTKVSGSSLTPKGFMDAVSKIKTQAAA